MNVLYGKGTTEYGPGVEIQLDGGEVATAIHEYVASFMVITGPMTTSVNGHYCKSGEIYVDPSGTVTYKGNVFSGRGPKVAEETEETEETEPGSVQPKPQTIWTSMDGCSTEYVCTCGVVLRKTKFCPNCGSKLIWNTLND